MNDGITGKTSKAEPATNWRRLRGMSDEQVHAAVAADPEIRPTDEAFWKTARVVRPQKGRLRFRPDIHFDPKTDDAIIWGDLGDTHFRLVVRRALLLDKYGLKTRFDEAGAKAIIKQQKDVFERLAQDAYETGATEIIIG
jgi:hypothetical protein